MSADCGLAEGWPEALRGWPGSRPAACGEKAPEKAPGGVPSRAPRRPHTRFLGSRRPSQRDRHGVARPGPACTDPAGPRGEKAPERAPGGVRSPTLRRPHRRSLAARPRHTPGAPSASAAGTASHGPACTDLVWPARRESARESVPRRAITHPQTPSSTLSHRAPSSSRHASPSHPPHRTHPASSRGEKAPEQAPGGVRSPTLRRPHRRSPAAPPMPALAPPPRARTRASHARTRASHARTHAAPARPTPTRDPTTPQPRTRAHQRRAQPPPPGPFRCRSPRRARMGT